MRALLSAICISMLVPACISGEDPEMEVEDNNGKEIETTFENVTLRRSSGATTCINPGTALSSRIFKEGGSWFVEATVLERAPRLTDPADCLFGEQICFIAVDKPARIIDAPNLNALASAIDAIPAMQCQAEDGLACDPCLIVDVTVDSEQHSSFCCGAANSVYDIRFAELTKIIDSLSQ